MTHSGHARLRLNNRAVCCTCSRPVLARRDASLRRTDLVASLFGRLCQALSGYPPPQCRCRSRARASLRTRHQGPSIMGFEDEVEQSIGRPCRQFDGRSKRPNELTSSIVPEGHHSTVGWISVFLLSDLVLYCSHAAATSLVQRNSVPSTHMRCMITASR